jgi:hypothetical protein
MTPSIVLENKHQAGNDWRQAALSLPVDVLLVVAMRGY